MGQGRLTTLFCATRERLKKSCKFSAVRYCRMDVADAEKTDFDDSAWSISETGKVLYTEEETAVWIRFSVPVPEMVFGLPVAGKPIRLRSLVKGPTELYIDGKLVRREDNWIDFQTPEIRLCDNAQPGRVYSCAVCIRCDKANWGGEFDGWIEFEEVDDLAFSLDCMEQELRCLDGLPEGAELAGPMRKLLEDGLQKALDADDGSELLACFQAARRLAEPVRKAAKRRQVHLVAHAHIDMNWLWNTEETRAVVQRDFSTMCMLMEEFPDFRFSQSQCSAYAMAEEADPALFARVKEKIRGGQWEVTASAWVEHDSNLPSGESLARQITMAQAYTEKEFGLRPTVQWAPDTFGHSANVPQLLRKSGITRYFHSRCFPDTQEDYEKKIRRHSATYPLYDWEGQDGSRVLTATEEYGGEFSIEKAVDKALQAEKEGRTHSLLLYGVCDHGGGPTRRDIRHILSCDSSPMLPRMVMSTIADYFDAAEGEESQLYLHRGDLNTIFEGCYTSHADIKGHNRRMEALLFDAEVAQVITGDKIPREALHRTWKTLLFHQFHDILDGCAVRETYREADQRLRAAEEELTGWVDQAAARLTEQTDGATTFFNWQPHPRSETVHVSAQRGCVPYDEEGTPLPCQRTADGTYLHLRDIPPFGSRTVYWKSGKELREAGGAVETEKTICIDYPYYYVEIKKASGEFVTFFDKQTRRFLVKKGFHCTSMDKGIWNTFSVTNENTEMGMSAWVIGQPETVQYIKKDAVCNLLDNGPLVVRVQIRHVYRASVLEQEIFFDAFSPFIRFDTRVDWRERGNRKTGTPMLRVDFQSAMADGAFWTEIPFGAMRRPASGEEYPQLRWSAVEDEQGGVLLLNTGKYGVRCAGNTLSLSLIRSSWEPDKSADIGEQRFTYQLGCFSGALLEAEPAARAACLHSPLTLGQGMARSAVLLPLPEELPGNLVISGYKMAEDGGGIVLRVYEAFGQAGVLTLRIGAESGPIYETDTAERERLEDYPVNEGICRIPLRSHEIKTLYIGWYGH